MNEHDYDFEDVSLDEINHIEIFWNAIFIFLVVIKKWNQKKLLENQKLVIIEI